MPGAPGASGGGDVRGWAHRLLPWRYWRNVAPARLRWGLAMNKDQVKGVAEKVKGKVNETVGKTTGNKTQELKGDVQQGAGEVRKAYGDAKEEAKDNAKRNAP